MVSFVVILFIFGAAIGSFLNVVIWRLPRGRRLTGRSQCPACQATLGAVNLVPVISYLVQGGRCQNCGARISWRYPLIELITGLLFAAAVWFVSPETGLQALVLVRILFIITILVAVFVIDLEHYLILDIITWPAAAVVLASNVIMDIAANQSLWDQSSRTFGGLLAAAVAGGFFYLLWRMSDGKWMGFGDVKLNVLLGLALGWPLVIVGLFLAFMLGAAFGLGLVLFRGRNLKSMIPFGTFLSVGAVIALFYGPSLWQWYIGLLGWR